MSPHLFLSDPLLIGQILILIAFLLRVVLIVHAEPPEHEEFFAARILNIGFMYDLVSFLNFIEVIHWLYPGLPHRVHVLDLDDFGST